MLCSFLHGVLEGLPGLYIQTQTYFICPCSAVPQSAVLFTSVRNKSHLRKGRNLRMDDTEQENNESSAWKLQTSQSKCSTLSMVIRIKKTKTSTEAQLPVLVMQGEIHSSNLVWDRNLICVQSVFLICSYDGIQSPSMKKCTQRSS